MKAEIKEFMDALKDRTVGETEFHQAVQEVIEMYGISIRQTRNIKLTKSSRRW